jgi:hypothetical protein
MSFFSFVFGFPIWLIATGFVVATKQRRGTLGGSPTAPTTVDSPASQLVTT